MHFASFREKHCVPEQVRQNRSSDSLGSIFLSVEVACVNVKKA